MCGCMNVAELHLGFASTEERHGGVYAAHFNNNTAVLYLCTFILHCVDKIHIKRGHTTTLKINTALKDCIEHIQLG